MYSYCIIPDNPEKFLSFLSQLPIKSEDKELIKYCKITKVEVHTALSTWDIFITVPKELSTNMLMVAEEKFCTDCGLKKVNFIQSIKVLEDYLAHNWLDFVAKISNNVHSIKHLLTNATWNFDGQTLTIEAIGELAAEIFSTHGTIQNMQSFILAEFNRNCTVKCITTATTRVTRHEDLLTPEYLEALTEHKSPSEAKADNPIIFGRNIKADSVPMSSIQDEARNIVVEGQLVNFELRELRSGRQLLTFDMGDLTDGLSGKVFFEDKDKEQFAKVSAILKKGMTVKAKGTVQFDKYSNELVLYADSMCKVNTVTRMDNAPTTRIELHAHTRMSNMDAVVSAKDLIKTAANWGHSAVAITDHGVVQAFPEAHEAALKAGIKVIYGMEGYLVDEDLKKARHIIILAQNSIGLRNLYRLVSLSHIKYLYRTPRVPRKILMEYREGLLLGSACEAGELIQAILRGENDEELFRIAEFYDYLEIQPIGNNSFLIREGMVANEEGLRKINRKVCEIGVKLNKLVVATCDVHFLNPEDEVYRRIMMAGKGFSDADQQPPLYFRTTEEMMNEFVYLGNDKAYEVVVENPRRINELIEIIKPIPDELYSPQIPGAEDQIRSMSYHKAEQLYGNPLPPVVAERLKYELDAIINNGFAVLYLIAHKLVKKSLDDGYLVGSRGSVGSSFVATMTDITEVNPLPPHWSCPSCKYSEFVTDGSYGGGFDLPDKICPQCNTPTEKNGHDIPFAVFMGFHGDKVPDIDLNFSGHYQPTAHKYTEELFGKDNVFRAGTIATVADKTAYGYVKNYFNDKGITPRNAYINALINGCTGVKRTTGQHPGGIMVVPRDMDVHHFTPIQHPADDKTSGTITTHFDYHSISSRLVKLDILGHDDPTVIRMLEDLTGIDAQTISLDDTETMSLFSSTTALNLTPAQLGSNVGTFGIPEFGTKFVRQMLEDTKPKTFSELVRISGFSHGTDVWLNNAQDLIKAGTAKLSEAISARDDIMMYLIHKGVDPSLAFKTMEGVRKGKGIKPEDVAKLREKNVPEWYIESCQKIKYMFPKAHAVAYVMMAFRIAYCKVHHPLAFYASYFTVRGTDFDAELVLQGEVMLRNKLNEFESKGNNITVKEKGLVTIIEMALEMYLRGFTFQRVDLYKSDATKFLVVDNGLLPPLSSLQGLGENAAHNIALTREGIPFSSMEDLRNRARLSKTVVDILKTHGCLTDLPESDQMMLFG
ncbi:MULTISPECIES: PolC-type DNA polymerase III [Pelosinus]|uniref:DNA polymerase III PolC-type n=1 Tax=Pelosinus fermentans B4 TaxID=1149862 RepID=I8RG24_9FIRM|nr:MULTISPECIES: PolC-type DNA polymerase III [Pelosinus]EIW18528.1 DNA polymerase III, alpha subunit [Pelosinus fermentans B4]EIW24542.1 DNA polymerase III polC-type [Pelosinus fermentans A11]OAM94400.1 DNA polymerase III polC-type [Pelosinus fermentans DSM 17108]SDR08125.1 DNA polymerase-3 subunit alpha [Pelosinus fermentans]